MRRILSKILTISIIFAAVLPVLPVTSAYGTAKEYYVNPGARGSDTQSGTANRPFKTIGKAVQTAAEYLAQNSGAEVTIYLNDGTYKLADTIEITDRTLNGGRLSVKAINGAQPVISGGKEITGWTLYDAEKNIYSAPFSGGNPRQLYINGKRAIRARTPDDYLKDRLTTLTDADGKYTGYQCSSRSPLNWTNADKIEFVYASEWANHRCKVSNVAAEGSGAVIHMANGFEYLNKISWGTKITTDSIWYIENAYEFLDEEREFYVDTDKGRIYYKPAPYENMQNVEAIYPAIDNLLHITNQTSGKRVENVAFENVSFMYAAWNAMNLQTSRIDNQNNIDVNGSRPDAAINIEGAENIHFRECTFAHVGGDAIQFKGGIENCSVQNSFLYDISAGAISFGEISEAAILGTDPARRIDNNAIENCVIHDTGVEYAGAAAITLGAVSNMQIHHNEIYNTPYSGMHIGWGWNNYANQTVVTKNISVKYNYLHDIMITGGRIKDGGAIYTLGKNEGGCVTAYNYVKNQYDTSSCLYNDEGTNDWVTHHNVVDNSGLVWSNGIKPRWMHWHINTIVRCHMYENYTDSDVDYRNGTDCVMEKLTIVPDENWPRAAVNIMKTAGVESACEFWGDTESDGEEILKNGEFDYADTFSDGWTLNSKNTYEHETEFDNTANGSAGSMKVTVSEGGELLERTVPLRRNSFYHFRAQVKLFDNEDARILVVPFLKYGEEKIYFEQQSVVCGAWTEIQTYFQPPVAQSSINYSTDSLYDDYKIGLEVIKDDTLVQDILYLDDIALNIYHAYYNPNFQNNFEGWEAVDGVEKRMVDFDSAAEGVTALVETGDFPDVSKVALFSSDNRTCAGVKQNFAFEKNTVYDVSYWVKAGDTNGKISTLAFPLGTNAAFAQQWPYAIWAKTDVTDSGWTHICYQVAFGNSEVVQAFDSRLELRYQNSLGAGENATAGSFYMAEFRVEKSKNSIGNPYFLFGSAATRSSDDEDFGAQNQASGLHWETYNSNFRALNNQEQVCFDGAKACGEFTATAENPFIGQNVMITEGGRYSLTAWVKADGNIRFTVDGNALPSTAANFKGWKKLSAECNFDDIGTHDVEIAFDTPQVCLFKDFSVRLIEKNPHAEHLSVLDNFNRLIADCNGIYQDTASNSAIKIRGSVSASSGITLILAEYSAEDRLSFAQTETVTDAECMGFEKTFSLSDTANFSALRLFIWDSDGNISPIEDTFVLKRTETNTEQQ